MAGERKGKAYEAFVKLALDKLKKRGEIKGEIFWNKKPSRMSIEPDFTIGPNEDNPEIVILVTHSGSAKNSDMKFWRNIGELVEAKVLLTSVPKVYSIAFDSVIKADLKVIQASTFDGQLLVGDDPLGPRIASWISSNDSSLPSDAEAKSVEISKCITNKSAGHPAAELRELVSKLSSVLKLHAPKLDALWTMERARPKGRAPLAKPTFLRRGVGKLMLLDDFSQLEKSGKVRISSPADLMETLIALGFAAKTIAGVRVTDSEMLWARKNISERDLKELLKARDIPRVKDWIAVLRGLATLPEQLQFLHDHWDELTRASSLFEHLKSCHANPTSIFPKKMSNSSHSVWLFHLLVEWIKLAGGTRTGFGLAKLVDDIDQLTADQTHVRTVEGIVKGDPIWHSKHTIGLGITDWHSVASKQEFAFTDHDLARVSDALARLLIKCEKPLPKTSLVLMRNSIIQTNLEAKLLTYRNFKPFEVLVGRAAKKAGKRLKSPSLLRSCFGELAADGIRLDPRSSGTSIVIAGKTLINWQSATDAGRGHKKKELCGRAVALRYVWDEKTRKFASRPGIEKLVLLLDGTWDDKDLASLVSAGWDEVFYPDQIDELARAIV
jgi:hypothetical protein